MSPPNPPAQAAPRRAFFLLLFVLVVLVFHSAFQGEFLRWDDDVNIWANPHLRGLGWEQIKWSLTDTKYYWRYQPLAWLTWNGIYQFVGLKPFAYHAIVVLLQAVNAGLVFLLIDRLLQLVWRRGGSQTGGPPPFIAFLATAVWAFHPMRAEPVAWAVELVYVMPLTFLLLSLLTYLRVAGSSGTSGRFYWFSIACFAASLFTFPIALGGLMVFLALDILPLNRLSLNPREWFSPAARRVWLEKIPFLALTLLAAWLNLYARAYHVSRGKVLPTLDDFTPLARAMQGFYVWAYYAWKPLLPLNLTPVPMQLYDFNPLAAPFVLSATFVTALTAVLFVMRRRWPAAFLVWLCHLALLVPMLGLSEHPHFPSDRYGLVVSIGGVILLAGFFAKWWGSQSARRPVVITWGVLICGLMIATYQQSLIWRTNESLFTHVLAGLPAGPMSDPFRVSIHLRRAAYFCDERDFAKGATAAREALKLAPNLAVAHRLLGYALMQTGDLDTARASYHEAVRLDVSLAGELNDLGVAYAIKGQLREAAEQFRAVLQLNPASASASQNLVRAEAALAAGTNAGAPPKP